MKTILFCVSFKILFLGVLLEGNVLQSKSGQGLEKVTTNDCDVVIREQYGLITSPGYPGKYPRYSRCHYTVYRTSQETCGVKLTMEHFEVAKMTFSNCSADFLELQNGVKRYKLCGELPSGSKKFVYYPDNEDQLVFKFQSTFHQKPGFSIEVKQLPFSCKKPARPRPAAVNITTHETMKMLPPCVQMVGGRIGRITFPDFSEDYLPVERCTYKIRKSESRACVVQMDFSSFEVTESAGCETDYLQLPSGQRLCGVLGGKRKLLQFPSDSDELTLEFVSSAQNGNSFDIQLSQLPGPCDYGPTSNTTGKVQQQCDKTLSDTAGRITSPGFPGAFGPNYKCLFRIYRPDPSVCQIELDFVTFSLGRHNPPGCHTGAYLELPGKNRLCQDLDGKMLLKVSEFKDPVVLNFHSDSQSSGRGFDIRLNQVPNTCPGYNVHPEIPNTLKRCYQEVSSHSGYFSSTNMHSTIQYGMPTWCEFVVQRADPTVCRIYLQLSSRTYLHLPCVNNFIHLPNGERMCISLAERREVWIPKGSEYITMVYYNTNNPDFHLFIDQVTNSCKRHNFENYRSKTRRWAWNITPR